MTYKAIFDGAGLKAEFENGACLFFRDDGEDKISALPMPMVVRDIEPYRNMIDGQMIGSRTEHRELLRRNNCFEVGNETVKSAAAPVKTSRREMITRQLADVSDKQANKVLKQLRKG